MNWKDVIPLTLPENTLSSLSENPIQHQAENVTPTQTSSNPYTFADSDLMASPSLIFYKDLIELNTTRIIGMAGSPDRLWPHVKTHKSADLVALQKRMGINRFKCATIAEAEMLATCQVADVLLAYPLVGPNIVRFVQLQRAFPEVRFWAIGDDLGQLIQLGQESAANQITTRVLLDVNPGMNRTGVPMEMAQSCYDDAARVQGIEMAGIHCYDGHRHEADYAVRYRKCQETAQFVLQLKRSLEAQKIPCETLVMGGSPSFPCYIEHPEIFLSPGTIFIHDYGYVIHYPDLPFVPAAVILSRVISCTGPGQFTLDLGSKGIAADPVGLRGQIVGLEHAEPLFQSEEHWAWQMVEGHESACPSVGDCFFVIPTHICPTSALYAEAVVVEKGQLSGTWPITARNRRLTY